MVNLKWGIRRRMEVMTISLSSSLSTSNLKWHIRRRMEAWLASYAAGAIAGTFYNPIIEEQFIKATIHSFDRLICHCANIDKKEEIWNDRGYMGCETFFFYKFKHLFSFKILYRRLWGQIHKISLDTIVEIHLLLFPLLRLLWLSLIGFRLVDYFSEKIIAGPHGVPDPPSLAQMTFTQCTSMSELKIDPGAPPGGQI